MAQAYFVTATRENELAYQQLQEQNQRIIMCRNLDENNQDLEGAAYEAGVLPRNFGLFHRAGYEGQYGGLGPEELKKLKGIEPKEDLLDRMGRVELAANNFRATQTSEKLRREGVVGQTSIVEAHREVETKIRELIGEIGGTMPEELPAQPSIKPLLKGRRSSKKGDLNSADGQKEK